MWLGIAPGVLNERHTWSQESCVMAGYCLSQLEEDLTSAWNLAQLEELAPVREDVAFQPTV